MRFAPIALLKAAPLLTKDPYAGHWFLEQWARVVTRTLDFFEKSKGPVNKIPQKIRSGLVSRDPRQIASAFVFLGELDQADIQENLFGSSESSLWASSGIQIILGRIVLNDPDKVDEVIAHSRAALASLMEVHWEELFAEAGKLSATPGSPEFQKMVNAYCYLGHAEEHVRGDRLQQAAIRLQDADRAISGFVENNVGVASLSFWLSMSVPEVTALGVDEYHGFIERRGDRYFIRDNNSSNGTFIGIGFSELEIRESWVPLAKNTRVSFGGLQVVFEGWEPDQAPSFTRLSRAEKIKSPRQIDPRLTALVEECRELQRWKAALAVAREDPYHKNSWADIKGITGDLSVGVQSALTRLVSLSSELGQELPHDLLASGFTQAPSLLPPDPNEPQTEYTFDRTQIEPIIRKIIRDIEDREQRRQHKHGVSS